MRISHATLALLLTLGLTAAANAQALPVMTPRTMVPAGPGAANGSRGITVNGSATSHVAATSAQLTLLFVGRNGKLTLNAATLQPVIDALVASGVAREAIALPINLTAPGDTNNASITASVDHPTAQMLKDGVVRVGAAVASIPDVLLSSANVRAVAADCAATQDATRGHAIENAHAKAAAIAKQLGVKLGPVLGVNSYDAAPSDGSCSWQYFVGGYTPNGPMTPEEYVTVPVTSTVQITYGIK